LAADVTTIYTKALITEITGVAVVSLESEKDKSKLRTKMQIILKKFKTEIEPVQNGQKQKPQNPFSLLRKTLAAKCLAALKMR
jgi:hypothetical protein